MSHIQLICEKFKKTKNSWKTTAENTNFFLCAKESSITEPQVFPQWHWPWVIESLSQKLHIFMWWCSRQDNNGIKLFIQSATWYNSLLEIDWKLHWVSLQYVIYFESCTSLILMYFRKSSLTPCRGNTDEK